MESEQRHEGWLRRAGRVLPRGLGHPFPPAVASVGTVRRPAGRDVHGCDREAEDDRMRLVAALLVLGSLLVWILFLQG